MIVCDCHDWNRERHAFHPVIDQAIRWITDTDFSQLDTGKYAILPEDKMFCLVQEMMTEPASARRAESHFSYIDIQFLLAGSENIGVARAHPDQRVTEDFAQQRDVVFYQKTLNESVITLLPGMFAIFFPYDIHRPCCAPGEPAIIRKAVIKIHRDLFTA